MTVPRVAIGLPVRNGARFLRAALDAILGQSFGDFALTVSDNCSTDDTPDICDWYAARDARVRVVRQERNIGMGPNFDYVFETAPPAEYFLWATHDDLHLEPALARLVEALDRESDAVLAFGKAYEIDEDGAVTQGLPARPELCGTDPRTRFEALVGGGRCVPMIFGLIRRRALEGSMLHASYAGADRALLAQLALRGRFHEIDETTFAVRDHPSRSIWAQGPPWTHPRDAVQDPARAERIVFPEWRRAAGYARAIRDSKLPAGERLRCWRAYGRWLATRGARPMRHDLACGVAYVGHWLRGWRPGSDRATEPT